LAQTLHIQLCKVQIAMCLLYNPFANIYFITENALVHIYLQ